MPAPIFQPADCLLCESCLLFLYMMGLPVSPCHTPHLRTLLDHSLCVTVQYVRFLKPP